MWDTFKLQVKAVMEHEPQSLEDVAHIIAVAYDNVMKTPPAGDLLNHNPVELGNVQLLENMIKIAFMQQKISPIQLPIINIMSNGFIGYWTGATLSKMNTPLIPAAGSTSNLNITTNVCAVPGIQVGIPFTYEGLNNVDAFLDKFIMAANLHLTTLQGITMTNSVYPPVGTVATGFIPWSGFIADNKQFDFGADYDNYITGNDNILNQVKTLLGSSYIDAEALREKGLAEMAAAQASVGVGGVGGGGDINVNGGNVKENLDEVEKALRAKGITNPAIITALKANVLKETGGTILVENLNYSTTDNARIRAIFGSRVANLTDAQINALKANAQSWGNFIYGSNNSVGKSLGNTQPGDGYLFRGRGFVQLTGRYAYTKASKEIYGDDRLVKNPDLINTKEVSAAIAAWEVNNSINSFARKMNIDINTTSQQDANKLVTSVIAGRVVDRGTGSYLSTLLSKVDGYSAQLAPPTTPNTLLASNTPQQPATPRG
jgi:putative chitinase